MRNKNINPRLSAVSFCVDAPTKFIVIVVTTASIVGSFITHKWLTVKPANEENEYRKLGLVNSLSTLLLYIEKFLNFGAFPVFNFASGTQERAIFLQKYHTIGAIATKGNSLIDF